jgi:ribonuclease BN (tRNA processing enzyme)
MGLPLFLQACYILKRTERLDVIVPAEAVAGLKRLLNLTYLFPHKLGFELEFHPLTRRFEFEMRGLRVTPHANPHLRGHAKFLRTARLPNKMECFSFVIRADGYKIIYSADLDSVDDLAAILGDTDLLIVEGMHVDLSRLGELCRENRVDRVLLTHLPEDFDLLAASRALARQGLRKVTAAREGLTIRLRSRPQSASVSKKN